MAIETSFCSEETFSQQDFRRWVETRPPSDLHHYELIRGRIVMSPPAGAIHGCIGSKLNAVFRRHVERERLGLVFDASAGFELPSGDTLEPDVSFVSRARWDAGPRPTANEYCRIVPSLVVEILSPSTARRDRTAKLVIYAQNGVEEYWIVDPRRRQVAVHVLRAGAFASAAVHSSGRISSAALPGLDVRVEELFADLD